MLVRSGLRALAALLALAALGACGAPAYTYVVDSNHQAFVKVPSSWRQVDQKQLEAVTGLDSVPEAQRAVWLQAYDASADPSPEHVFGDAADVPAVFVAVQQNSAAGQGKVSLDAMRDSFYPVSDSARQYAGMTSQNLTGFALMTDQVLTPGKGLRGVHDVYRYTINGGAPQVFDQTVYTNDDASTLYLLFVRCSAACYQQRSGEITAVASSFTVREQP